jgi:DNA-binding NarL/FixJ family response regulator
MGASEQAVELLALSVHHPANEPPTRRRAEQLLVRAKALLSANVYDAARVRGEEVGMDDMAQSILEQLRLMKDYPKPHLQYSANQLLVDPLTPRELEILYHMGAGLTSREIADQLIIGVSTVKKHITHIYNKLDASDRIKAINRARALELLPTSTP